MKESPRFLEPHNSNSGDQLLNKIASALGVDTEYFFSLPNNLSFHVEANSTRWVLRINASGSLHVHCIAARTLEDTSSGVPVAAFLAQHLNEPQGKALAALIDHALTLHMQVATRD